MLFTKRRLLIMTVMIVAIGFAAGWFFGQFAGDEPERVVVERMPAEEAVPEFHEYPDLNDLPPPEERILDEPDPLDEMAEMDDALDMDPAETPFTAAGEILLDEERVVETNLPEYPPLDAAPRVPDETVDSLEVTVDEGEIEKFSQPFKIPENGTRTLLDGHLVVGVNQVTTNHVIVNLNTQQTLMASGDYLDTEVGGLACRLMLLDFSWSLSTPYADFTLNCDPG